MFPILFQFSGFTLYTQTVFLFLAFVVGLLIAVYEGKRLAIARFELTNIILSGFISAIFGARLLFLLIHWNPATLTLKHICVLGAKDGGFAFHGGLFAGGIACFLAARYYKFPAWRLADVLAPGLAGAMFCMRLGCLCNGCDYGVVTTMPWGIPLYGASRHPIQLYEGVGNLVLLPWLIASNRKPRQPGLTFLLYLFWSGLIRFGVDFYREDSARVWNLLTIPQLLALGMAIAAAMMLSRKIISP